MLAFAGVVMIKVVIADDHRLVVESLRRVLDGEQDMKCVGVANGIFDYIIKNHHDDVCPQNLIDAEEKIKQQLFPNNFGFSSYFISRYNKLNTCSALFRWF